MTAKDLNRLAIVAADRMLSDDERQSIAAVLASVQKIVATCRRHASPASNVGAHALAAKILREAGAE